MDYISIVQNTIHEKSGKTFKEYLEIKHAKFPNGWDVENGKVVFWFSPTVKLEDNPLRSVSKYVWQVKDGEVTPVNGRALEMVRK